MINLFVNYFTQSDRLRQAELKYCLCKNLMLPELTVYIFHGRLSYKDFFEEINKVTEDSDVNIISNTDIYFDDTIKLVENIEENECYALCRWDVDKNGKAIFYNHVDSQDVWIFRGKIKEVINADFKLGVMGCDNAIAYRLQRAGYNVLSPSEEIKAYHLHNSNIRNYISSIRNEKTVAPAPHSTLILSKLKK